MRNKDERDRIARLEIKIEGMRAGGGEAGREPGVEGMLAWLLTGGPELPGPVDAGARKAAFMTRGDQLRAGKAVPSDAGARPGTVWLAGAPALARLGITAFLVVAVVALAGFGTAYARPGSPLYAVRRAVESASISTAGSDTAKARVYDDYTTRRLEDLRYVIERGMSHWYYPLARDIESGIGEMGRFGARLGKAAAEQKGRRARVAADELEGLLPVVSGDLTLPQRSAVERGLKRLREQHGRGSGDQDGPPRNGNPPPEGQEGQSAPGGGRMEQEGRQQQHHQQQQDQEQQEPRNQQEQQHHQERQQPHPQHQPQQQQQQQGELYPLKQQYHQEHHQQQL